jgi:hypothetical protein
MKSLKLKIIYTIAIISLGAFALINGCKNPTSGLVITTNSDYLKNQIFIQFANANENGDKQPGTFELTIHGEPEGFNPVSKTFVITKNGPNEHLITLVDYSQPASGTASIISSVDLNANGSIPLTKIEIPATTETPLKSEISIKDGTTFLNTKGDTVKGGSLKTDIIYFSAGTESSLNAFPGGFNPENIQGASGPLEGGGAFTTAGFFSINMKIGDNDITSFSKPVEIKSEISDNIINPETGNAVVEGDVIPIWSLQEETGEWVFGGNATIIKNASNKLEAKFEVNHLTAWNIDWYATPCKNKLNVTFNLTGSTTPTNYWVRLVDSKNNYLSGLYASNSWSSPVLISNNMMETIPKVPNQQVKIIVMKSRSPASGSNIIAQTALFNPCSQGNITVTIPQPIPATPLFNIQFNSIVYCQKKKINVLHNGYFSIREKTLPTNTATNFFVSSGKAKLSLKEGVVYVFTTVYEGKTYSSEFSATKSNAVLPNITNLSGTATYTSSTNTLTVDVRFSTPDC